VDTCACGGPNGEVVDVIRYRDKLGYDRRVYRRVYRLPAWVFHLVEQGLEYSVGFAVTDGVRAAIIRVPRWAWSRAVDAAGGWRDGADIAVAGLLDLTGWATRMRVDRPAGRRSCGAARPAPPAL
jgi:hypothetical protein